MYYINDVILIVLVVIFVARFMIMPEVMLLQRTVLIR